MRDYLHPSMCRDHVALVVLCVPSHVVACMNLILYAETPTRAQKQMLDLQHAVSAARSALHAVPGCSSSPSRRDSEVGLLGGSVVCLHHWSRTVNPLLGLCCLPDFFLCSGSSDLIRAFAAERNQKTMLLCINMFLGISFNLC